MKTYNSAVMEKTALIFDLDGTLWDSTEVVAESWSISGKKYFGEDFALDKDAVKAQMGLMMEQIAENIAKMTPNPELGKLWAKDAFEYEIEYLSNHPGKLFENEITTLQKLKKKGYVLLIMSNCQKGYIEDYLNCLEDKSLFSGHLCYGDTHTPKNVSIRILMENLGVKRAAYVGDTAGDEEQTRIAGIPFFHASYGFGKAVSPDATLRYFEDVLGAAEKFLPL